jgi:hypothetical protein
VSNDVRKRRTADQQYSNFAHSHLAAERARLFLRTLKFTTTKGLCGKQGCWKIGLAP